MRNSEKRIAMLDVLWEHEQAAHGAWALDHAVPVPVQQQVEALVGEGLVELADRQIRAEMSARLSRPVRWAARLTPYGRDVRTYAHARPPQPTGGPEPGPGEQLVELRPAQMDAVRVFVSLARDLATGPAEGLAERVRTAPFSRSGNCWQLCLTEEQTTSVAYALYLHRLSRSEAEANRFARDYNIVYRTVPATGTPVPVILGRRTSGADDA
ncbi:DUF6417 family protein [Streptomyces sp. NPDC001604]|uniref:DUF6417 family protein n=1 Tax=Streptomyces sp. NPDC001604 TaxID=3364593 RepID=UPI0036C15625